MKVQFKKREDFDKEFKQEGTILLYENRIEYGINQVDDLAKEMARKSKLKLTNILGDGTQLVYSKDKENIYISENRKIDAYRLAAKSNQFFTLLKETFENKIKKT
jgi:hypothetical protein